MRLRENAVALAIVAALSVPACGGEGGDDGDGKTVVAASIFPVYDLCRMVAGDAVEVRLLLPPGKSEHNFAPTPGDVKKISDAKVAFLIGLEMDEWLVKTVEATGGAAKIVRLGEKVIERSYYVPLLGRPTETAAPASAAPVAPGAKGKPATGKSAPKGGTPTSSAAATPAPASGSAAPATDAPLHHDHPTGPDPHVWMSVSNAIKLLDAIAVELIAAAPEHKATFESNAAKAREELGKLHDEVKAETAAFTRKGFVSCHNSFGYFADAYGLEVVAVIEPFAGTEPSPAYLNSVLTYLKAHPVGALYIEPQLDPKPGEILAKEIGLPPPLTLDPIGGLPETDTYAKLIRFNVASLAKSLK